MNKSLPARALFYAVIVSIFVAMISAAILLSSYHQHMLVSQHQKQRQLMDNCQSGIELLLATSTAPTSPLQVDLFQQGKDSVWLEQRPWGLLEVALVKSWAGQGWYRDSVQQIFFLGKELPPYALKLSEGNAPLYVCGNTKITGDAFLPTEGVKRGYFNAVRGKPYTGEKLIYGEKKVVQYTNMNFLKEHFASLALLKNASPNTPLQGDSILQTFDKPTLVAGGEDWTTGNIVAKGNVLLIAYEHLQVSTQSILEDVILIAPQITIEAGFQGSIQAFAWDSLVVEEGVNLTFPSVLSLLPPEQAPTTSPELIIGEQVEVYGTILVPSFQYYKYKARVSIAPTSTIVGQVWVNGFLEQKGKVHGTVFCDKFLLTTPAGVYENYLLDAIINRTQVPEFYLTPPILGEKKKQEILKYLPNRIE